MRITYVRPKFGLPPGGLNVPRIITYKTFVPSVISATPDGSPEFESVNVLWNRVRNWLQQSGNAQHIRSLFILCPVNIWGLLVVFREKNSWRWGCSSSTSTTLEEERWRRIYCDKGTLGLLISWISFLWLYGACSNGRTDQVKCNSLQWILECMIALKIWNLCNIWFFRRIITWVMQKLLLFWIIILSLDFHSFWSLKA